MCAQQLPSEDPPRARTTGNADFVQSLERGLAVIRAFGADHPELTLSEVARATGLTRAAARRFLHTLVELGYVRSNGRLFALRPRILELGYAYLSSLGLPEVALPHLESLVATVHESSSVAVLDGDEIVYVARAPTRRIMTVVISVGTRFPAYATSLGRALLSGQSDDWLDGYLASVQLTPLTRHTITDAPRLRAELLRVRAQGWALVDEELEEGLRAVAAPIHDPLGKVIAAVNVSAPTRRGDPETLREELLPHLLRAARRIEEDLRAVAPTGAAGDWKAARAGPFAPAERQPASP
jgi:IclR family pca regulon transcriptional regulator